MIRTLTLLLFANFAIIAAASAADPIEKTDQVGDWTVRCVSRAALPPCEIVQAVKRKDVEQNILQFSLSYAGTDDRYAIQFMLPLGLFIQGEALVRLDDKTDLNGYVFTRCEPQGCFIDRLTTRADLNPFFAAKKGIVAARQTNGQTLVAPISFEGFGDAVKMMVAKNEAWAKAQGVKK
ncbi:invasion associated locus B family protein [Sphingorhabdus sp. EL138]|uniref:invasion associated locus B family protein n=1 Tax=Sphingorhabdus sp. EL138 TaxID=2073156 RepID=UPI0025DB8204|nr:invasion associated locus B family protein [Sphingorhabdus sp. EL138]